MTEEIKSVIKIISISLAMWWLASIAALFFGYEPSKFTIGVAFFCTALLMAQNAREFN